MARHIAPSAAPRWALSLDFGSHAPRAERSGRLVDGVAAQDAMVALFDNDFADQEPVRASPGGRSAHVSEAGASTRPGRTRVHP
jgi:hypothetical protein